MSQLARLRADDSKYVVSMSFNRQSYVAELVEQYFRFSDGKCSGNSIVNEPGSMSEMITGENGPLHHPYLRLEKSASHQKTILFPQRELIRRRHARKR